MTSARDLGAHRAQHPKLGPGLVAIGILVILFVVSLIVPTMA